MAVVPPRQAVEAMEAGASEIVRRLEVYEADGETPWALVDPDDRFIDGSVSIDYSRDERRTVDLTLANHDNALRANPYGGLWYDKVFKLFRGVKYENDYQPKIAIIEEVSDRDAYALRSILNGLGYTQVAIKTRATKFEDVADFDILVSWPKTQAIGKSTILKAAYNAGRSVITCSDTASTETLPFVVSVGAVSTTTWGFTPVSYDAPVNLSDTSHSSASSSGQGILAVNETVSVLGTWTNSANGTTMYTGVVAQNQLGGRWFHTSVPTLAQTNNRRLWDRVIAWMSRRNTTLTWETQIGEFVIDNISEENFPYNVKVVGRDYTKRCILSKVTRAVAFEAGTNGRELITALAANAGIRKIKIPQLDWSLPVRLDYAAQTPRWQIMKEIATAFSHDIYFDMQGYLTVRPYQDPVFSSIVASFSTDPERGNLVKYSRSVSDSELYNHIVITSEGGGDEGLPYFGEALNTEPDSPTNIERIGDRPYFWSSAALGSDEQCRELANSWLKIYALESYDLSFDAITYPWLDVGDISDILDPRRISTDPTKFLLSTINIPMSLGPMSASARRLSIVADREAA